jgi:hypothetical protein
MPQKVNSDLFKRFKAHITDRYDDMDLCDILMDEGHFLVL